MPVALVRTISIYDFDSGQMVLTSVFLRACGRRVFDLPLPFPSLQRFTPLRLVHVTTAV
jgi:hypothetical protein